MADRYTLELQALAASLATPADDDGPTLLTLDQEAGELLLDFERDLEPRLAADSGDLAHLAGWAAKLAGATCRLAALLHLASHLRDGWARPITADTFAAAVRLADYLIEHARAVFDLMGADPRIDDARWLLDWISRTNRRSSAAATPTRPPPAAASPRPPTSSQPYGCSRSTATCAGSTLSPPRTRTAAADRPRRGSWSTLCRAPQKRQKHTKTTAGAVSVDSVRFCGARLESPMRGARLAVTESSGAATAAPRSIWAVTLSNENGPSRSRPCPHPPPAVSGGHKPTMADRRGAASLWSGPCAWSCLAEHGELAGAIPRPWSRPSRRWARTMASVGIRKRVSARTGRVTYQVWWLLDDGSQGAETVSSKDEARDLVAKKRLGVTRGAWQGLQRGQLPFSWWAEQWWEVWAADPTAAPPPWR